MKTEKLLEIAGIQASLMNINLDGLAIFQSVTEGEDPETIGASLDAYMLSNIGPLIRGLRKSLSPENSDHMIGLVKERYGALIDQLIAMEAKS